MRIERRGTEHVALTRRDPVSPFLDAVQRGTAGSGRGRCTCGSMAAASELIGARRALALSLQHRLAGEHYAAQFMPRNA